MKKQLLLLAGMLCFVVTAWAAPTAKAIYCAANTTLYFTYDEVTYNTTTAYDNLDGNTPTAVYTNIRTTGYAKESGQGGDNLPWNSYRTVITTAKFLENFSGWSPTNLGAFFARMTNLATIEGGENLNTSNVTSLREIFYECSSLTNLDFASEWNTENVENMAYAFYDCRKLTDIEGMKEWKVSKVTTLNFTFYRCGFSDVNALENWDVSSVTDFSFTFNYIRQPSANFFLIT